LEAGKVSLVGQSRFYDILPFLVHFGSIAVLPHGSPLHPIKKLSIRIEKKKGGKGPHLISFGQSLAARGVIFSAGGVDFERNEMRANQTIKPRLTEDLGFGPATGAAPSGRYHDPKRFSGFSRLSKSRLNIGSVFQTLSSCKGKQKSYHPSRKHGTKVEKSASLLI
jgi:hypothetical protein